MLKNNSRRRVSIFFLLIGPVGSHGQDVKGSLSPQTISSYAVPALKGFVRSITLSKGSSLQV